MNRGDMERMALEAGFSKDFSGIYYSCGGAAADSDLTSPLERFFNAAYAAGAKDKTLKPLTYEQIAELNLSAVTTTDAVNDVRAIELAHGIGVKND